MPWLVVVRSSSARLFRTRLNTVQIEELSPHGLNIVTSKENIFSPLLFFPGGYGLQNFNRYRKIRHFFPLDMDVKYFTNFVVRLERLIETGHLTRFFSFLLRCFHHAEEAEKRYILRDLQTIRPTVRNP